MSTTDALILFVIKGLGAIALVLWLVARFAKAVLREWLEFWDWWSAERHARSFRPVQRQRGTWL
jgi:hypothetical protein